MEDKIPHLVEEISELALADNSKDREKNSTYYPRVSSAGKCVRALTYKALGAEEAPLSARQIVLFADGTLHEDDTARYLERTKFPVKNSQKAVTVGVIPADFPNGSRVCPTCEQEVQNNELHGHIDGMIETNDGWYLWEHKTMNERALDRLDSECNEGYVTQCCSYIKGLQSEGYKMLGAILLCKGKNNSQFKQVNIEYDFDNDIAFVTNDWNGQTFEIYDVVNSTLQMHATVQEYANNGLDMPDRPYDFDDWQCQWCDFKDMCWKDVDIEINSRENGMIPLAEDDPLATDIREFHLLRRQKSAIESQVKQLRSSILTELADREIKGGTIDGLRFGLYTMKKQKVDMQAIPAKIKREATKQNIIRTITTKEV